MFHALYRDEIRLENPNDCLDIDCIFNNYLIQRIIHMYLACIVERSMIIITVIAK